MNKPFGSSSEFVEAKSASAPIEAVAAVPSGIVGAPSLERRRLRFYAGMMAGDLVTIVVAFLFAGLLYEGSWLGTRAAMQGQLLLPIFYTIAFYNRTYSSRVLIDPRLAMRKASMALVVAAVLLNFVAFYTKSNAEFSRGSFTLGLLFSLFGLALARWLATRIVQILWQGVVQNQMVVADGGPQFHLENAQRINAEEAGLRADPEDPYMLDRLGRLMRNQDRVVISCPSERRAKWAFVLKAAGVRGELVSEPAHALGALGVIRYEALDRTTLIVSTGPLALQSRVIKRGFDIIVASLALIALLPILLWAALRIKFEDGGPVLFAQRRLGRGNRFFNMLKFRSMSDSSCDKDGTSSTARDDQRVTKIGARLRSTSVDELPQLVNVLRGEMSLVGPRPHALGSRANNKLFWEVDGQYWQRHSLKPGMTGLAQVRGYRGATECEDDLTQRLQSDLEYIEGWSLIRDIRIIWRTWHVLRHDKAY